MVEQTFNNRYHLEQRLGEGGTAIVYGGVDSLLRRRVAVKVLRPQFAADAEFVRRFYHEAESAAKLTHPNVVNIYDVGREHDSYFIVMELIDGTTLAQQIREQGSIPERRAVDYAIQVCRGLAYAHRQGLLHRDIKPANVLITKDDIVKISDFGIARAVERQTMAMTQGGMVMGSVYYLSPEQARDHQLQPSSDLYSLGVVIYEMLTGRTPFDGDSPVAIALKHVSQEPPALPATVSPVLAEIVTRLLRKEPTERFATADELAAALRGAREAIPAGSDKTLTMSAVDIPTPPPRPSPLPDKPEPIPAAGPRIGLVVTVFAILVLCGLLAGFFFVAKPLAQIKSRPVAVPGEIGAVRGDAEDALVAAGFTVKTITVPSDGIATNHVISQDPIPGAQIAHGGVVTLTVSTGATLVDVPDLAAFSENDARRLLSQNALQVKVTERFDNAAKGSVIAQHPAAHEKIKSHATVTLVISDGPQPAQVPNVTSMTVDAARKLLQSQHLTLIVGQQTNSDTIPSGTIAAQDPKDGATLASGGEVTVVVSAGAAPAAVPDVTLSKISDAISTLQSAGFAPQVSYSVQPGPNSGNVIGETPTGGHRRAPRFRRLTGGRGARRRARHDGFLARGRAQRAPRRRLCRRQRC